MSAPASFGQRPILFLFVGGLACVIALNWAEWTFTHRLDLSFDPWALAALFVAQIVLERDHRPALIACAISIPLSLMFIHWQPSLSAFSAPISVGFASFAVLSVTVIVQPEARAKALFILGAGSLVILGQQISQAVEAFTTTAALTFDNRAYLVDLSLGLNPVGLVQSALALLPGLLKSGATLVLVITYQAIMFMMAMVVLLHLRKQSAQWKIALMALLLAGAVGGVLYHLFPAAGPRFAFPAFPELPPASALTPAANKLDLQYIRNCMPSLHTTWALLIVINSGGLARVFRVSAVIFALLTVIATLALGQHYLIDLIVAAPFSVAIQTAAQSLVNRRWPAPGLWIGGACVALWIFVLAAHVDWLLATPGLTLTASALTVATSILAYRLDTRETSKDGSLISLATMHQSQA